MVAFASNRAKPLFPRGPSLLTRTLWLVLLAVSMMAIDFRMHVLDGVRNGLHALIYPVRLLADLPNETFAKVSDLTRSKKALVAENQILKAEQFKQNAKLQKMASLEAENLRLRALVGSAPRVHEKVTIAKILTVSLNDPFRQRFLLNRGTLHKVHVGQTVIDANGIVGQVVKTELAQSHVILITDIEHALAVENVRTGVRSIIYGTGDPNALKLPYLPNNADFVVGDQLVATGLDGKFPADYPVAEIIMVEPQHGLPFSKVYAKPIAHLDRIREVLLLWPQPAKAPLTPQNLVEPVPLSNELPGLPTQEATP